MPFSLGSYLLGVGTVVGALAFGFGGGLVLTHTTMKESPVAQTRVERLARAHSNTPAARQAPVTKIAPAPNPAAVASDQVIIPDQDHSASLAAIKPDAHRDSSPRSLPTRALVRPNLLRANQRKRQGKFKGHGTTTAAKASGERAAAAEAGRTARRNGKDG